MDDKYTLGPNTTAEKTYGALQTRRQAVLDRARELSELTIPSLFPPEGFQDGDKLYTPYQDIGARGVNNIASRLDLTMLPPNRAPFRHEVPSKLQEETKAAAESGEVAADPDKILSELNLALAKRERAVKSRMDSTPLRLVNVQALKQLVVGGNVLWRHQELDAPIIHSMDQYVVKRNAKGQPLLVILKEDAIVDDLPDDVQEIVKKRRLEGVSVGGKPGGGPNVGASKEPFGDEVCIYTVCRWDWSKGRVYAWQEVMGSPIPNTRESCPADAPPMWPMWMIPMFGRNWGRAYSDEYYPGLLAAENYSKALQEGAIAAAWTLFFTRPGSRTRPRDLRDARNLDILVGSAEDITTMRLEKSADFQFAADNLQSVEQRLGYAFLLNSAVQRQGERVTAEEIRLMARELEATMGGVYASLAEQFKPVVQRFIYLMERDEGQTFKKLPEASGIKPRIVTGIDSLGRSYDDQVLDELLAEAAQILGPQEVAKRVDGGEYFRRKAAAKSIDPTGLIRTDDDVAAMDQQAQMQALLQQAAPGAAQEAVKGMMNPQGAGIAQAAMEAQGMIPPGQAAQPKG